METIGYAVKNFICKAYMPNGAKEINTGDFQAKWKLLLFYVADFSAVCPTEIVAFNKEYERFQKLDVEIVGISTDSLEEHERFVKERKDLGRLKFPLVSDTDGKLAEEYGVFDAQKKKIRRSTFILDPENRVRYILITGNYVGRSTNETYRVITALQSGNACVVNWEPKV